MEENVVSSNICRVGWWEFGS